jgi:hypothetical protein
MAKNILTDIESKNKIKSFFQLLLRTLIIDEIIINKKIKFNLVPTGNKVKK